MEEERCNNISVIPLDVLGRMRATRMRSTSIKPWPRGPGNIVNAHLDWDRLLQLLILNKELLVNAVHQPALIAYLTFVHTACHNFRFNGSVRPQYFCLIAPLVPGRENLSKPYHGEECEVITMFL